MNTESTKKPKQLNSAGAPGGAVTRPRSICIFCGASQIVGEAYFDLARQTGRAIAHGNYRMVYGGGGVGLMGASARAAHKAGGSVLGIIPQFLTEIEDILDGIEHRIVKNMHERKQQMYQESDAFIVLPGGIGTLEEAIEIMSWMRLHLHSKPMVFVDKDGYWAPLITLLQHTIDTGFSPKWMNAHIFRTQDIDEAMRRIEREWKQPSKKGGLQVGSV